MARYTADEAHAYFCTMTVLDWIPVFIDERYITPIIDSLEFTRRKKGLLLFAYVVMPNHIHLIAASDDLHAHLRDFKRFKSRTVHDLLKTDGRTTILDWLDRAAQRARRTRGEFSFWTDGFHPQAIWNRNVFDQKLRYLHANPVRKGLVATPEAWRFSSAGFYNGESEPLIRMDLWNT